MEIKDIKAEYRMQEMHKLIYARAESGLTVTAPYLNMKISEDNKLLVNTPSDCDSQKK